jgi:ribonuclease BN (tRNA processing enzyme)
MKVTTVGTGCCIPSSERRSSCLLAQGGGTNIAVDLGLGGLHGLLAAGVAHHEVDAVLLTHFHLDHTAELAPFLFAANYDEKPRSAPLTIAGGPGLLEFFDKLAAVYGKWIEGQNYRQRLVELKAGQRLEVGGLTVLSAAAAHTEASLGYRLECEGGSVVVTGDTGPCGELVELARGADLLVAECSLGVGVEQGYHLNASQAGRMAAGAGVGRLVLTHFYPSSEGGEPCANASHEFSGEVFLASDGMEFEV